MIVLRAVGDGDTVRDEGIRGTAVRRLEHLEGEELLGGDTPSVVIVMEVGDSASALSKELGFDVLHARYTSCRFDATAYVPTFEMCEEYPAFYEVVFVLSDYGDGAVVLIPKLQGIDTDLLAMCAMHAVPAPEESP